jgi:hypothetical protein
VPDRVGQAFERFLGAFTSEEGALPVHLKNAMSG